MSANPPHRVEAIFQKVVDLRPSEQSRELARLCGSDRALRAEVEILLNASETVMGGFLETGVLREAGSIGPTGTGADASADTSADPSEFA